MEDFVAGSRALALCEYVQFQGFDARQLVDFVKSEIAKDGNDAGRVSAAAYFDLFHEASLVTGMTDFGLRWGRNTDFRQLGPLGTYVENCASIREAAQEGSAFVSAKNWGIRSHFVSMGRHSRCEFHVGPRGRHPQAQLVEGVVTSMMPFARRMLGTDWRPLEIWFAHQPLSSAQVYEDAFGCPVTFGMLNNAFVAPTADFDRRQGVADKRVKTLVGSLLRECERHDEWSYISQCKTQLRQVLATQQVTINHLGARLGVNPAVLQRRLEGVGLCFRSLVTQVRLEIVDEEAKNGALADDMMGRLGFSRANAMNRFLKLHERDVTRARAVDARAQ
jgi:hypothetical protein